MPPVVPPKVKPVAIASHGRGGNPTLEVVSVHRHNTHPGHGSSSRRHGHEHGGDLTSRGLNRISKRLADVRIIQFHYI